MHWKKDELAFPVHAFVHDLFDALDTTIITFATTLTRQNGHQFQIKYPHPNNVGEAINFFDQAFKALNCKQTNTE